MQIFGSIGLMVMPYQIMCEYPFGIRIKKRMLIIILIHHYFGFIRIRIFQPQIPHEAFLVYFGTKLN